MIEGFAGSILIGYLSPVALFTAAVCMLVLRAGASRVFFDIVGTFQAAKMIKDADSAATVFEALYLDAITGIQEAGQELSDIFNSLTDTVIPVAREFEEAQIQLEKFLQEGEDIERVREQVEDIGISFAFAGDEAMAAAAKMAQISGVLGPGSLAAGTQIGMEFGLISGMETEAAMQRMINLQQQTKFMTENLEDHMDAEQRANIIRRDSMQILDQLNTIENRSAATMEQITFVMNQFASQAHLANEEIRSMAALSAVMIETGEEQGKGGRALKMMYARLGSDIGGARTEMERLGVAVTDANGDMRPLSDMLQQLEERFMSMSGAEQQATAQIIAGNRHYTRFLKLMTNLDRVKELEVEAAFRLFPAMDEIERRRDTELFQLQQAEANVQKYSAALGQALIPSLTAVTEKQSNFLKVLSEFAQGPMGSLLTSLVAVGQNFRSVIGPVATLFITFKSLSIAAQTQLAVMRALNSEQLSSNAGLTKGNNLTTQQILLFEMLEQEKKDLQTTEKIGITLSKELKGIEEGRVPTVKANIMLLVEENAKLSKNNGLKAIHKERIKANNEELKKLGATELVRAAEHPANMQRAREQAASLNQFTMLMGGAGTIMMLFGKNEKMMRAGMILNTGAILAQVIAMISRNAEQMKKMFIDTQSTTTQVVSTNATRMDTIATIAQTAAKKVGTVASLAFSAAMRKAMLSMGILGAASLALGHALDKLGVFSSKATDEIDEFTQSMVSAADILDIVNDAAFDPLNSEDVIKKNQDIIDAIELRNGGLEDLNSLEQEEVDKAKQLIDLHQQVLDTDKKRIDSARILATASAEEIQRFGDLAAYFDDFGIGTVKKTGNIFERRRRDASNAALEALGFSSRQDAINEFAMLGLQFEDLSDDILDLYDAADGSGVDVLENLRRYSEIFAADADVVSDMVGGIDTASDALDNFNNAREELFFGSRNNMTGDLIRQVQQQGVENLIANTEVVMTNVFNGLTIPQMADIVIEEIEGRGRLNGFNITTS
jgi:TP901 family phage tail tape measure protein